jgi:MbtH protein
MPTETLYAVIANCEDQYAVWPLSSPILPSWRRVGTVGTKDDCLEYVRRIETERQPSALRRLLERDVTRC